MILLMRVPHGEQFVDVVEQDGRVHEFLFVGRGGVTVNVGRRHRDLIMLHAGGGGGGSGGASV